MLGDKGKGWNPSQVFLDLGHRTVSVRLDILYPRCKVDLQTKLAKLIEDIAEDHELELVEFDFFSSGNRKILRIFIDKEDGVTVDHCSRLSRDLGYALDLEDMIEEAYHLEVSSPGVDRPLKKQKDFLRNVGRRVKIRLAEPLDGEKRFIGEILTADENAVTVSKDGKELTVKYDDMLMAKIQLEF